MPLVVSYVEPWLSDADIEAGERWGQSIATELAASNFGIVCITSENVNSPWVLFEAVGAEYSIVAGQAAFRYSLMRPPQRADLTT